MKFEYLFDTYAWVEYFQASKKGALVKDILETHKVATPILAIAELADAYFRIGEELGARYAFIIAKSTIINVTPEICIAGARIKHEMRTTEKDFGLIDGIIFSIAKELKAKLVSGDPHFKHIKEVIFLK